jgi:hypothetical protein
MAAPTIEELNRAYNDAMRGGDRPSEILYFTPDGLYVLDGSGARKISDAQPEEAA